MISQVSNGVSGNVFVPASLGNVTVKYDNSEFFVISGDKKVLIQRADLSKELRGISESTFEKCLEVGYLKLSQRGKDYSLEWQGRLKGGGPIFGLIGYWGTKAVCYGAAIGAGTAAVVATGGAAAGAGGAALAAAGGAVGTAGVSTGVGAVAAAVGSSAAATAVATEATAAVIASAGTIGTAIAAVESASTCIGAALAMCPFLP